MKITFLRLKKNRFGGAERYLQRVVDELNKRGVECEVVYSKAPKFLPGWMRVIFYNFQVCLSKSDKFYFSLERVVCPDIYRAGDGVHRVFMKIENKSILNPLHLVYLFIEKRMFKKAKRIITNSNMVKREIIETYSIPSEKIRVVYNGVPQKDVVEFEDIKKEFGINKEKIILYVGSGFKRKGVKEALEIISKLKGNFKFFVIGKEKNISWYINYAKELGIEEKVIFTGPRSDVDKFYSMADVFLFPTRYEPFSNVVLEAMNFECVPFTTLSNGASEILPDEWIIDENVTKRIQTFLDNDVELNRAKKEAKNISKNFTIEKNVDETIKVINEVIN